MQSNEVVGAINTLKQFCLEQGEYCDNCPAFSRSAGCPLAAGAPRTWKMPRALLDDIPDVEFSIIDYKDSEFYEQETLLQPGEEGK